MKKIFTLVTLIALGSILYWAWQTNQPTQTTALNNETINTTSAINQKGDQLWGKHPKGIYKAMKHIHRLQANQHTGEVALKDVYEARVQADRNSNKKSVAGEIAWEFMGPNNVGGRTRALLIDQNNPNRMYAGGVAGGIWISDDAAENWRPHPQNATLQNISVGSMTQSANGDVYVGTGEGFYFFFGTGSGGVPGSGIYKSSDGGNTFEVLGSTEPDFNNTNETWAAVNAMASHPTNNNLIYAANLGGLYLSEDAGATWSQARVDGAPISGTGYDVKTGSDGSIHALVGTRYFKSTDGVTFVDKSGMEPGQYPQKGSRKALAIAPSDPNYLYVAIINQNGCLNEVLQSSNGGDTWVQIGEGNADFFEPMSNSAQCQGNYDLALAVHPADKERIFLAGVSLWDWTAQNGWKQLDAFFNDAPSNPYYVHADKHIVVFHPTNHNIMYIGSDGGVGLSTDALSDFPTFSVKNKGYNITQFYSVDAGLDGRVIGGTQDNGTQYIRRDQNSNLAALEVSGGDGGFTEISKINPNGIFAATPEGNLFRSSNGGDSFSGFLDSNIDCEPLTTGGDCNSDGQVDHNPGFVTAFFLWEDFAASLEPPFGQGITKARFFTGNGIGEVWMTEEPLNFSTTPNWKNGPNPDDEGYLAKFNSGGEVSAYAVTSDGGTLFVGNSNGDIIRVSNLNYIPTPDEETDSDFWLPSKYQIAQIDIDGFEGRHITSISVDINPNIIYVTFGQYGNSDYVVRSTNALTGNVTFESIQGEGDSALPTMPVYSSAYVFGTPSSVVLGTELGVWVGQLNGTEWVWTEENDEIGRVPVFSVKYEIMRGFNSGEFASGVGCEVLYLGTHGRGLYRSTSFTNLSFCDVTLPPYDATSVSSDDLEVAGIKIYPNPVTDLANVEVSLSEATTVNVHVFNLLGQRVAHKDLGNQPAGKHQTQVDVQYLPAGQYLLVVETPKGNMTRHLTVQ